MKRLGTIILAVCIGLGLLVMLLVMCLFFHNEEHVPFIFAQGGLNLWRFVNLASLKSCFQTYPVMRILALPFIFSIPAYWGVLAWIASKVKKSAHLISCWLLFLTLQVIIPCWAMSQTDLYKWKEFLCQLSSCHFHVIIWMIVIGIANGYLFTLPFVFYWLSRRKPLHLES